MRDLLRPMARFPPNEIQLKAIEEIKKLVLEDHVLAVPDEFAAITAAIDGCRIKPRAAGQMRWQRTRRATR